MLTHKLVIEGLFGPAKKDYDNQEVDGKEVAYQLDY